MKASQRLFKFHYEFLTGLILSPLLSCNGIGTLDSYKEYKFLPRFLHAESSKVFLSVLYRETASSIALNNVDLFVLILFHDCLVLLLLLK